MVSDDLFKEVLGRFCSGVTIVTFKNSEGIHGLTVSSFASLSLDPPLILICIKNKGASYDGLIKSQGFCVNILSEAQKDLAFRFADSKLDSVRRFHETDYELTESGVPIFSDNLGYLECITKDKFSGGDHTIFVGEVKSLNFTKGKTPLIYYNKSFHTLLKSS